MSLDIEAVVAEVTVGWTASQKAALAQRLSMEATRRIISRRFPTAGALAQSIDSNTVQTPALQVIDEALEWALSARDARLVISLPPQEGKLVADYTPVPTPTGWTTHGELKPGDMVMHPSGQPVKVLAVHPPASASMRVHVGGGDYVDVHPRHEWRIHRRGWTRAGVVETRWIAEHTITTEPADKHGGEYMNHLPRRSGFILPDVDLPTAPYSLGLRLGGGACNHHHSGPSDGNRIPPQYLRASDKQRRALLAGLINSGGHTTNTGGRVSFGSTSRRLTEDVAELVRTLGYTATQHEPAATKNGGTQIWSVVWAEHGGATTTQNDQHGNRATTATQHIHTPIISVERIPPTPGRCITVDSPDGLYLVGRTMLPTHNSTRVGVWGTLRALVQNPDRRIVLASYSQSLARTSARTARNLIKQHGTGARDVITGVPLPDQLGLRLADDNAAASSWSILGRRGGMYAVGVGGSLTGERADVLIIDDPIKGMTEADSAIERDKVITWWESVAQTRLAPGAPVIIIQTRWHEKDLTGHILSQDRKLGRKLWRWVNIPAVAADGVPDALGREPGVAMQSARGRTPEDFARIRQDVGERVWSALYMGMPTPTRGGLFSREWFDRFRVPALPPEPMATTIVSIDPAETGRNDEAGIIGLTVSPSGVAYVTDDRSGHMQSNEWSRRAIILACELKAGEVLFEAFTTGPTYERVIRQAWAEVRREARLLKEHGGRLDDASIAYSKMEQRPSNCYRALKELDGVPVPDQEEPPFRITPWRARGDKVARAAGARQAASTGRLRIVDSKPELEAQAEGWQPGQDSPDRMDALVNGYERAMQLVGRDAQIATPEDVQTTRAQLFGDGFWSSTIG